MIQTSSNPDILFSQVLLTLEYLREEIRELKSQPTHKIVYGWRKPDEAVELLKCEGVTSSKVLFDLRKKGVFQINKSIRLTKPNAVKPSFEYNIEECIKAISRYKRA